jgi:hypothetical protein
MPLKGFAQKPFGSREVSPLAEPEFNGVTVIVDCTVEIPPLASNLDVSLVDVPFASDSALTKVKALQQL